MYLPDETVLRMPHGVVDTPELAAEIGSAVLMDIYGKKEMSMEYPLMSLNIKVHGLCSARFQKDVLVV